MEEEMDAGKFWLPTEFLNDDEDEDVLMDSKFGKVNVGIVNQSKSMTMPTLYGPNSDMNFPADSVIGSTETESDEEVHLSELSRKLAQSTTLEDELEFRRCIARSPKSILCGCKQISNRGNSDGFLSVSHNQATWDFLSSAVGEFAMLRMQEELSSKYCNPNRNIVASQSPRKAPSPNFQFHVIQAAQLKQQQLMKHQQYQQFIRQTMARNGGRNMNPAIPQPLSSAWPTLQQSQQPRRVSGMRAVFLGNPNVKRECTGTGVFLPRQIGAPIEPRKKRGCSTVLLPDRVAEALNLNHQTQTQTPSAMDSYDFSQMMK